MMEVLRRQQQQQPQQQAQQQQPQVGVQDRKRRTMDTKWIPAMPTPSYKQWVSRSRELSGFRDWAEKLEGWLCLIHDRYGPELREALRMEQPIARSRPRAQSKDFFFHEYGRRVGMVPRSSLKEGKYSQMVEKRTETTQQHTNKKQPPTTAQRPSLHHPVVFPLC